MTVQERHDRGERITEPTKCETEYNDECEDWEGRE